MFFTVPTTKDRRWNLRIPGFALAAVLAATGLAAQTTTASPAPAAPPVPAVQPPSATASPRPAQPGQLVPAQQAVSQPADGGTDVGVTTLKTTVNEVNLIFTVTDKHGHYIPNLQQSDFALLDDQKAPAHVNSFHQQINLPLRVGIMIDTSTSIHSRFQFEQESATDFLLQVLKARSDRAFVMGFDVTPTLTSDWTNDLDALETGVKRLSPGGGTALYDAVYTACRDKLLDRFRTQEPVRKAIILLSDGDDNQSRVYLSEAIKECQRSDTIIYTISTNWTPSRGEGDKVMSQLAEETGGLPLFPASVEEVSTAFKSIEEALRSQYALTYTPADFRSDGAFRTIYLYCNDRRYQVRSRKGYFAPKQ